MITMQEMEKELAIYRKNFTAVRLISEADILRTIEARKHNPASRACPCRDGRMTSQGCRNCIVLRAYMDKCKKIKLEYDDPNVYQVTARYLHVEGGRYVLELVQKLYEAKLVTYPRTSSRHIPEDVFAEVPLLLERLASHSTLSDKIVNLDGLNRRSVDASKVTDHHALLVTPNRPLALYKNEQIIYDMIAGRMVEAFSEECVKDTACLLYTSPSPRDRG